MTAMPAFRVFKEQLVAALALPGPAWCSYVVGDGASNSCGPIIKLWDAAQEFWLKQHKSCTFERPFRPVYADANWWTTKVDHDAFNCYIANHIDRVA